MSSGTKFEPVLDDPHVSAQHVKRVVLLSGKLYYDLIKERTARPNIKDSVAFVRIEELSPFPFSPLADVLSRYGNASEVVWLQEEPRNQGAFLHIQERINAVLQHLKANHRVQYHGRDEDAVPAPGVAKLYQTQQRSVVAAAFDGL